MKLIDLTGQRFGMLTVERIAKDRKYGGQAAFECLCDCGKRKVIAGSSLRRASSRSCGCQAIRWGNTDTRKHGLYRHRLAGTWRSMKERCYNPNHVAYHRYGGRGITVCDRWLSLENFVADNDHLAKDGTTLDRIDNDGSYTPENCRWVSRYQQSINKSTNRKLTLSGKT